jgi:hypothetical protein
MATLSDRILGATRLDVRTYEEVEADTTATGQAVLVVVLSSVAAGIGSIGSAGTPGFVRGIAAALLGWVAWAFLTYIIGTKILPEPQTKADLGEMLRTTGFAQAPGLLRILGIVPILGLLAIMLVWVWMLVAMIIAVKQALDYTSVARALGVVIIGWLVSLLIAFLLLPFAVLS